MILPEDADILLSVVNTMLRDRYDSLSALCEEEDVERDELEARLGESGYKYDAAANAFKPV